MKLIFAASAAILFLVQPAHAQEFPCMGQNLSEQEFYQCGYQAIDLANLDPIVRMCAEKNRDKTARQTCITVEHFNKAAADGAPGMPGASNPTGAWSPYADGSLVAQLLDGTTQTRLTISCSVRNGFEFQLVGTQVRMTWPMSAAIIATEANSPVELTATGLFGRPWRGITTIRMAERAERAMLSAKRIIVRIKQRDGVDAFMFETGELSKGAKLVLSKCPAS